MALPLSKRRIPADTWRGKVGWGLEFSAMRKERGVTLFYETKRFAGLA